MSDAKGQNDGDGGPRDPQGTCEHLDTLALDAVRTGEAPPEKVAHVQSCQLCRRRLEALEAFGRDLAAAVRAPLAVPREVDDAVLSLARSRFARRRRRIMYVRRLPWAAAAAAALVLVVVGAWHVTGRYAAREAQTPSYAARGLPGDVDGSGRVDILDAFALARALEARGEIDKRWDLDGNGAVDAADVHAVAAAAVSLKGGSTI